MLLFLYRFFLNNNCLYIYITSIFVFYGVYLYFSILMYVKHHEQFEIGCGAILNKLCYYLLKWIGKWMG